MPAVVSLTPAPVIDRTYFVDAFDAGKVNRATEIQEFLSGKGINVSRTLRVAGIPTSAVLPIGREDEHLLFRTPYPQILRILPIPGRMRVNTAVLEKNGRTTNVNQKAVPVPQREWEAVIDMTITEIESLHADWLVVSGSVPRHPENGEKVDFTRLFTEAKRLGTRVAFDSSGTSLDQWTRSGLVNLIKPNTDEIATLVNRELHTVGDVLEAGQEVIAESGLEVALVSMGGDGALAITKDKALWGIAPAENVVNTTGAGDASLAGFVGHSILGAGQFGGRADHGSLPDLSLQSGLGKAVVYGALAVTVPTTIIESVTDAPTPEISEPPVDKPLSEPTKIFETPSA
ncbi:MAG: 1-phosphofructokinase family hexose kinase [Gulosibacter sp.]|uniref:1-phosphofructokinase family hexose kinase n=1 Tax=Gulosibacter sp. TaxID=2817531 RepID=UPI003F9008D2